MAASSYEELPLGEIADFRNGKGLSPEKYTPMGRYPVFGSNGQIARTDELLNEDPVVVIGRVGAYCGSVHLVFEPSWVTDNAIVARPKPGEDVRYLYYRLRSLDLRSTATGSAQPLVTQGGLSALRAPHAPPHKQLAIARILGALDDKIELNHKMNATLEAMARALFKSWFIDFDPVRAKAAGGDPFGMNAATAKLFPSEFVASRSGLIPTGWRATTLGIEVERFGGAVQTGPFGSQLHASDYVRDGVPVVMPKDISRRRVSIASIARIREHDAERLSRHRLLPGDIVYSRRGDVERHALIGNREAGWLCGTGCLLVRLGPRWPSPAFASFALDRPEARAWISQHAIGATMPNLNTGILSAVPLVMPPVDVMSAFATAVDSLEALIVARDTESSSLAEIRNALLPRLLVGSIDTTTGAT